MTRLVGTYNGEELTVTFTATGARDWIGDPSVPNGTMDIETVESVEVHSMTLLNVPVRFEDFHPVAQELIFGLHDEVEWEVE